jgi:hypothetical protein
MPERTAVEPVVRTVTLELTYPPEDPDRIRNEMVEQIQASVPTGFRLGRLLGRHNEGPTVRDDFSGPCWRMQVTYEAVPVEPKTWEGSD